MNFAKLILLFFALNSQIHGQGVTFFDGTWEECKAQAKKENKAIFIDAYTDWCGWCKVMDKKTFPNDSLGMYFKDHFIAYKMDMERGLGIKIRMKYKVNGFPSFLFLDKNGKLINKSFGYQEPSPFLASCKKALEEPTTYNYDVDVNHLDLNYPGFFEAAHQIGDARSWPKQDTIVNYLNQQTDLFSDVNWAVMSRFALDSTWNQFFLSNTEKYNSKFGKEEVDDKIGSVVYANLINAIKDSSEAQLMQTLNMVDQYKMENAEDNKSYYKSIFYKSQRNWVKYAATAEDMIAKNGYQNHSGINEYSWTLYKNTDNPALIAKASQWMKEIVSAQPKYMYLDTYAALLYKNGNLKEAKLQAEKAIEVGKENKDDIEETRELLKKIKKAQK